MDQYKLAEARDKVLDLVEGGEISLILNHIKERVAMEIINTQPDEVSMRNDKYALVRGIKSLEHEIQGYLNDIARSEEKD